MKNEKLEQLKREAEQGSIEKQYELGLYYGEKKDGNKSIYWYQKAAGKGHKAAQVILGRI